MADIRLDSSPLTQVAVAQCTAVLVVVTDTLLHGFMLIEEVIKVWMHGSSITQRQQKSY